MRLSEAIRLGTLLHPQAFGTMHLYGTDGTIVASCALGSAQDAGYRSAVTTEEIAKVKATQGQRACPECGEMQLSTRHGLHGVIAHLNDVHLWSREQIADWVETVEKDEEAASVVPALLETA